MRAKYDFKSRNQRELTIRKGELIEVSITVLLLFPPLFPDSSDRKLEEHVCVCPSAGAGQLKAVVESEEQQRSGRFRTQQCPGGG